jgi:hypothetical protein
MRPLNQTANNLHQRSHNAGDSKTPRNLRVTVAYSATALWSQMMGSPHWVCMLLQRSQCSHVPSEVRKWSDPPPASVMDWHILFVYLIPLLHRPAPSICQNIAVYLIYLHLFYLIWFKLHSSYLRDEGTKLEDNSPGQDQVERCGWEDQNSMWVIASK